MKRVLLWALLLVLTAVAIEALARLAHPWLFDAPFDAEQLAADQLARAQPERQPRDDVQREEVVHPYLGYVSNPASANELLNELRASPVSAYGLNDDKSPLQKAAPDRLIVGIFGGSVAHYFSLQGLDALRAQLGRAERFRGRELVVVRAALAGWKQPQQMFAFSYLLALGAHFDVVINLDGFNEATLAPLENEPKGVFPFFPRNWFGRTQGQSDRRVRMAIGEIAYLQRQRAAWAERFAEAGVGWSALAGAVWRARDRAFASEIARRNQDLVGYRTRDAHYVATGPPYDYAAGSLDRDLADVWGRSSLQMHELAVASGIEYYHFLQPNQYVPGSKPLHELERQYAYSEQAPHRAVVERVYPLLIEVGASLAARGVAFHDLTQIFAGHTEALYHDTCCHLNERGNELLGERIGAIIAAGPAG